MRYELLSLAGLAAVAQAVVPAGVKVPSTAGFTNPIVHVSNGGGSVCVTGNVTVYASTSKNVNLTYELPQNQSQVTETFLRFVTQGSDFPTDIEAGYLNVSGAYNISSTLCAPGNGTSSSTVQFLTHGIGFAASYWDFAPGYSYADVAAANGYTTFFYDRLGVGESSKPDAINVVQGPLEVVIAYNLINMLRNGTFANTNFTKVVGTGHSFGSEITEGITADYPTAIDAAILTGFSDNTSALAPFINGLNLEIAAANQPYRFAGLSNGYLVSQNIISNQIGFFRAPGFDPNILNFAEATKGTVTIGELLSMTAIESTASNFTGPIYVVDGAEDFPFCYGNCSYPSNKAAAVKDALYPVASNLSSSYLAPITGHGVNLHYSAGTTFDKIQSFIKSAGL